MGSEGKLKVIFVLLRALQGHLLSSWEIYNIPSLLQDSSSLVCSTKKGWVLICRVQSSKVELYVGVSLCTQFTSASAQGSLISLMSISSAPFHTFACFLTSSYSVNNERGKMNHFFPSIYLSCCYSNQSDDGLHENGLIMLLKWVIWMKTGRNTLLNYGDPGKTLHSYIIHYKWAHLVFLLFCQRSSIAPQVDADSRISFPFFMKLNVTLVLRINIWSIIRGGTLPREGFIIFGKDKDKKK